MAIRRSYDRAIEEQKERALVDKKILKQLARERLKKAISKKFQTCFIGAINSVEEHLGVLWAKNSTQEPTAFQMKMMSRWKMLRTEMLDKGNAQLRAMLKEIEEYDIDWNGHYTDIDLGE